MADDTLSINCGCGPRKMKNVPYLGGDDLLITSLSERCLPKDKSCDCKGSCGCESTKEPHGLELAHGLLKRLQSAMSPYCGCPSTGPLSINLANGNAVLEVAIPEAGPFDGVAKLTYNSRAASRAVQFGYGWADVFNPTVSEVDTTTADLTRGDGQSFRYTGKDANGKCLAPKAAGNALVKNGDATWTETQPDGFRFDYDTGGALKRIVNPAGNRWTAIRSGVRLTALNGCNEARNVWSLPTALKIGNGVPRSFGKNPRVRAAGFPARTIHFFPDLG